jgi:hypothetical protein
MTNNEFEAQVLGFVNLDQSFKPFATYDRDGDSIEFFATAEDYLAERIDALLTIYRSRDTGRVIGSLIKDVSKLMRDNLGVRIIVHDKRVRLEHLILAYAGGQTPDKAKNIVYQNLYDLAKASRVEASLEPASQA